VPPDVHTELNCLAGSLEVTWQTSSGALAYIATVTDSRGQATSYETTELHTPVIGVQCGMSYSVSVLARNSDCNSSSSPAQHVTTGNAPTHL